jgi:hypothetical protein
MFGGAALKAAGSAFLSALFATGTNLGRIVSVEECGHADDCIIEHHAANASAATCPTFIEATRALSSVRSIARQILLIHALLSDGRHRSFRRL